MFIYFRCCLIFKQKKKNTSSLRFIIWSLTRGKELKFKQNWTVIWLYRCIVDVSSRIYDNTHAYGYTNPFCVRFCTSVIIRFKWDANGYPTLNWISTEIVCACYNNYANLSCAIGPALTIINLNLHRMIYYRFSLHAPLYSLHCSTVFLLKFFYCTK